MPGNLLNKHFIGRRGNIRMEHAGNAERANYDAASIEQQPHDPIINREQRDRNGESIQQETVDEGRNEGEKKRKTEFAENHDRRGDKNGLQKAFRPAEGDERQRLRKLQMQQIRRGDNHRNAKVRRRHHRRRKRDGADAQKISSLRVKDAFFHLHPPSNPADMIAYATRRVKLQRRSALFPRESAEKKIKALTTVRNRTILRKYDFVHGGAACNPNG